MSREVVQIEDAWTDPLYEQKAAVKISGGRSMIGVPLLREGEPIGVIGLARTRVEPFKQREIELVTMFADQAVIAIENVRLFDDVQARTQEVQESLEYQTAISDVLNVISRSPNTLQPVLDTIVQTAARLCEAEFSVFFRLHEGACHIAASNVEVDFIKFAREHPFIPTRASCSGRAILEQRTVHVLDASTDPEYAMPDYRLVANNRTMLAVPLLRDGIPLGTITLWKTRVEPFTEKQIDLITTFADQALIAIENVRLFEAEQLRSRELAESLEQQTATSEVLGVISSSPGELEPVFQAMLENATRICEAKFGVLMLAEGDAFRLGAIHNAPQAFAEFMRRGPVRPSPHITFGRAVVTKRVAQTADITIERPYLQGDPLAVAAAELGGYRTVLAVPMLKEGEIIGALVFFRQEVRTFNDKQIALVQNFANQAVIAIENARLLSELRESLQQQTATAGVLEVISRSAFDLHAVFEAVAESSVKLCGARRAFIYRFDGELLRLAIAYNTPRDFEEFVEKNPIRPGRHTCAARAALERRTIHIPDILADPEYTFGARAFFPAESTTVLGVPIIKGDDFLGVIIIYHEEVRPFTENQIALVETFADQAAIAIENVRLLDELRQRTTDLTESLEQQTATSEVLRVISSSPGELQPVFDAMLENAVRICDATYGNIYSRDNDIFRLVASYKTPRAFTEYRRRNPMTGSGAHWADPMLRSKIQVHIADLALEQGFIERDPSFVAAVELGGARSALAVPMLKEGEIIGAFALARQEVRPFTEKQIALVTNLAAQAVIAIENTRLLNELRQRTDDLGRSVDELRALGEVSQAVNSTLDLEAVLSTIVAKAVQLSGTEAGAIYVFDDRRREFHLRATYGMDQHLIDALTQLRMDLNDPNVAQALAQPEPIQVADLREDVATEINEITLRAGYLARLVAPLIRGEDVVGLLVVRRRTPGAFAQNTVDLIKTFAAQSAVTIENARLFKDVQASLEDLRTTQDRLVQTQKLASLGQLTAGIAHEIKNPLNFVNNFSSVSAELLDELQENLAKVKADAITLAEIAELTNTLRDNLDKIVQHGKRADSIVKNMLLHSREGSGEHRPVDVNALVEESLNLAYHGARAERQGFNITLERSLDPAAGQVDIFPQEITRALLNLISNGFYAATKRKEQNDSEGYEPTLTASTKDLGDRVEITICDNGTGIPPKVREKMFNPFFTTKPAGEGTGLGLSISHDIIVKQHSGSIEVNSQPGEYTEVRIVLPRAAAFPH
jgi:two-component system, NtrC family, sensor kinase